MGMNHDMKKQNIVKKFMVHKDGPDVTTMNHDIQKWTVAKVLTV